MIRFQKRDFTSVSSGWYQNGMACRGFTLLELLVVILILSLLVAIVAPRILGRTDEARITATQVQIKNLEGALNLYRLDNGFYPNTEQSLEALVTKPTIDPIPLKWRDGGYLPKVPRDPWGSQFVYLSPGTHGDYDLISYGADREPGGEGKDEDIQNWDLE
jgi:general secretion pathway protein G